MEWYRKAAGQGNADAENNIGDLYENGLGVSQDYVQAMVWYRKAADQGIPLTRIARASLRQTLAVTPRRALPSLIGGPF
jgi:TPR repeat protein